MSPKAIVTLAMISGSTAGSCVPLLWGGSCFSFTAVLLGGIGGLAGIWFGLRLSR